jgi:hypothetical protein
MFICVQHGIALQNMKAVEAHYRASAEHKGDTQANWKKANEAASSCPMLDEIRAVPDGYIDEPIPEVQGLPVFEAWKCPHCTEIVASPRRAHEHLASSHPKAPQHSTPTKVFAQRWSQKSRFFLIQPLGLPRSTPNHDLVARLHDKVSLLLPSSGYSSVEKDQTPYLRRLGWVTYITRSEELYGLKPSELRKLTEKPSPDTEPQLARITSLLELHHEKTTSLLGSLPLLVGQHVLHHDLSK